MLTHEIYSECYKCLCRICGQAGCPHRPRSERRCLSCWRSHDFSPILDCDNFYFKQLHKYKIKRVHKVPEVRYVEKFSDGEIAQLLGEILRLLKSPLVPSDDINCIKSGCLCLNCPASQLCNHRCVMCGDWRGHYPVKLCAVRLKHEKGG